MLSVTIPMIEKFDNITNEFIRFEEQIILLEHSLVSLSKWESKWHTVFLSDNKLSNEQMLDYIKCMCLNKANIENITNDQMIQIKEYIDNPMSATIIKQNQTKTGFKEEMTSELIYYWMICLNIPFSCEKWHLNRLLKLITLCSIKNSPPKKMGRQDLANKNREANEARKKALNTRG